MQEHEFQNTTSIAIWYNSVIVNKLNYHKIESTENRANPNLNTQSCNKRPLCSTFTSRNVHSAKENMKKRPKKLLIIGPNFFLCTGPTSQTGQKQKSNASKSPLMQNWVFRLGVSWRYGFTSLDQFAK